MDSSTASSASQGHRILPKGFPDSEKPRDCLGGSRCEFQNEPYPQAYWLWCDSNEGGKQVESKYHKVNYRSSYVTCRGWLYCKTESQAMLYTGWRAAQEGASLSTAAGMGAQEMGSS